MAGYVAARGVPRGALPRETDKSRTAARPARLVHGGELGASAVEFAIAASVLISMIVGVMEMCLAFYSYHFVSEAARYGSRYAAVHGDTCAVSGVSCTATAAQIQSYIQGLGYPGINGSNLTVTTTYSGYPAGASCSPNANCANPGNLVTVKVSYPFGLTIPFLPASTLNLGSTSAMVISQ